MQDVSAVYVGLCRYRPLSSDKLKTTEEKLSLIVVGVVT